MSTPQDQPRDHDRQGDDTIERERARINAGARERAALDHVASALVEDVGEDAAEDVQKVVEDAARRYEDAPVRDFVPIMVERDAKERLRDTE